MTHQIVFLQSAVDDLKEIRRYIRKRFSQQAWLDAYAKIRQATATLAEFPNSGHHPAELPATHFLEVIVAKNRIIYEVIGQTIYIHIICDTRQDFKSKLARRPIRTLLPATRP